MKVNSAQFPPAVDIKVSGETAWIIFTENVVEIASKIEGDPPQYQYDEYRLSTRNRGGLRDTIEENITLWLDKAKMDELSNSVPIVDKQTVLNNTMVQLKNTQAQVVLALVLAGVM